MSLQVFHIIFIVCSILLAFGFSFWSSLAYAQNQQLGYLIAAIISVAVGIALIVYAIQFIKKTRIKT